MLNNLLELIRQLPDEENGQKIDGVLIVSDVNRFYFSGFSSSQGMILVTREEAYFLVDFRYYESALNSVHGYKVILAKNFQESLAELIKKHNLEGILIEHETLTLKELETLEKIFESANKTSTIKTGTLDNLILRMRSIKTPEEIKKIGTAQKISEKAFSYILTKIKNGVTEKDLALDLEFFMRRHGAEKAAFDLIVLSGGNTSLPHGVPGNRAVSFGDFLIIDMGAVFEGYRSDMTRTVGLGYASDRQLEVYNLVKRAQNEALTKIRAGVVCSEVDKSARSIIDNSCYNGTFGHALGHGVGIEIHEGPVLSPKNDEILQANMVITVEPGIYLMDEFGVRIEDMVVVTENGYNNLTGVSKELIII